QGQTTFLISKAVVPSQESWPSWPRNIILTLFFGGFLAVGLCFFLDYMDTAIKSEADVHSQLGSTVLARLPRAGEAAESERLEDLAVLKDPRGHAAEAFRSLRTALAFNVPGDPLRSVVVSSTFPAEGKSLVSVNLATIQAQVGKRTLVIDSDMRKPRLHNVFSVMPEKGLANLLASEEDLRLEDVVLQTTLENLSFLPCGPVPHNPVEMLDSKRFGDILAEIESKFEFTVFDSPPGITMADPLIMGKRTGGVLLVVRSFVTPKHAVRDFTTHMREADVRLLGVVLNNVDTPKGGYYGYYYENYRYYRPYGRYEEPGPEKGEDGVFSRIRDWRDRLPLFKSQPPPNGTQT
ncbi:polysaccharide biosynthesis tyrosine autokinase, partial [Verrucomicrobiota bacterium]